MNSFPDSLKCVLLPARLYTRKFSACGHFGRFSFMLAVSPVLQNPKVWVAEAAGKCEITQAQHNEVYACSFVRQMFRRICRVSQAISCNKSSICIAFKIMLSFFKYSGICRIHITCTIALWINLLFPSSFWISLPF